jgi:hypothetical protein
MSEDMDVHGAVHEPKDPEYSILKQRLARHMRHEGLSEDDVQSLDLVEMTKVRNLPDLQPCGRPGRCALTHPQTVLSRTTIVP